MYTIVVSRIAEKQLEQLPKPAANAVWEKIRSLATDPRPKGCKKLQGYEREYRIRSGDYRVVYRVEDDVLVIEVIGVGHRKDIYRKK